MIVYGDRSRTVRTSHRLVEIDAALAGVGDMPPGIARHTALQSAFIALGEVIQGIADADRAMYGADGSSPGEAALMVALVGLGRELMQSGRNDYSSAAPSPLPEALPTLPSEIELQVPEGYAFYGLYPEAYGDAALNLCLPHPVRVIGIRSIGVSLAAIVAAVLNAPPPFTVRPIGHPSDRAIAVAPAIDPAAHYVIVDEGPGRSGSSFAAVGEWLEQQGVPPERQLFLTSHANGPGSAAAPATLARWRRTPSAAVGSNMANRLADAVSELTGQPDGALQDISAGSWRSRLIASQDDWPPVDPLGERRKYLLGAGGQSWLLKFAGLGGEAERKLEIAHILHAAGFTAEAIGTLHGFIVQRWIDGYPLDLRDVPPIREAARYIGARAQLLPAAQSGASIAKLHEMALFNIGTAIGEKAAAPLRAWLSRLPELQARSCPIQIDGRCDPHEWIRTGDGYLFKTDTLDHHAGHDLIGCQDFAWDAAGFLCEFELGGAAANRFLALLDQAAPRPVDRMLLAFLTPCYLAFRLGAAILAAEALRHSPAEAERNRKAAERYAQQISRLALDGD